MRNFKKVVGSFDCTRNFPAFMYEGDYWNGWAVLYVTEEIHKRVIKELYEGVDDEDFELKSLKPNDEGYYCYHGYCCFDIEQVHAVSELIEDRNLQDMYKIIDCFDVSDEEKVAILAETEKTILEKMNENTTGAEARS